MSDAPALLPTLLREWAANGTGHPESVDVPATQLDEAYEAFRALQHELHSLRWGAGLLERSHAHQAEQLAEIRKAANMGFNWVTSERLLAILNREMPV